MINIQFNEYDSKKAWNLRSPASAKQGAGMKSLQQ